MNRSLKARPEEDVVETWVRLARQSNYSLKRLITLTGMSERQLERRCLTDLDRCPKEWLNEQRMITAAKLLPKSDSIKTIALSLGFKQTSHFSRSFKETHRVTASEFLVNLNKANTRRSSKARNDAEAKS